MADKILFVVGASGVGKTAAVEHLDSAPDFDGVCYFFDSIGVPSQEEFRKMEDAGRSWQVEASHAWVERLSVAPEALSVLEGQTAPSCVAEVARPKFPRWSTVLLDCNPEVRRQRLTLRGRRKLADAKMENWAAYLRGQADALHVPVLDTSDMSVEEVASELRTLAGRL